MEGLRFSPFEGLRKELRKRRRAHILSHASKDLKLQKGPLDPRGRSKPYSDSAPEDDYGLFISAMEGVRPLRLKEGASPTFNELDETTSRPGAEEGTQRSTPLDQDIEAIQSLKRLVTGTGFISLKDTSEFVSGGKSPFSPIVSEALHQGRYSVQAYLDLHGMDVEGALDACHDFFEKAFARGLRCIAFIHGRGLGSKKGPVLKKALVDWLERGPFRRRLVAYSSAPPWDGGTGVTYCLLKSSPYKRKRTKQGPLGRRGGPHS